MRIIDQLVYKITGDSSASAVHLNDFSCWALIDSQRKNSNSIPKTNQQSKQNNKSKKSKQQKVIKQTKSNSNFRLTCHYVSALSVPAGGVR